MSDDLTHYMEAVSRLRAEVETLKKANAMLLAGFGPVALEAADLEIDRLRARVSQLEGEARARESAYDTLSRLQVNTRADLSAALAHAAGWQEHAQRGWTERDALKARVAELEAALRHVHRHFGAYCPVCSNRYGPVPCREWDDGAAALAEGGRHG